MPSLDFYWPPIVAGARAAAAALGVTVQLRGSSYDPDEDRRQIARLVEAGQVQGLLLAPSLKATRDEMIDWIGRLPVPTILVERQPHRWTRPRGSSSGSAATTRSAWRSPCITCTSRATGGSGLVLSHGSPTSAHLLRGWQPACAELGSPTRCVVRESVALDARAPGSSANPRRLPAAGNTALIVHSDPRCDRRSRSTCAEQGLGIPDDMALVSYDDEVAHLAEPALTAVRPPKNHVGRLAVELMVSRLLDGYRRPAQGVLVAP